MAFCRIAFGDEEIDGSPWGSHFMGKGLYNFLGPLKACINPQRIRP